MTTKHNIFFMFAIAATITAGCGGGSKSTVQLTDYIPANAVGVMSLNAGQLLQKASPETIKKMKLYTEWQKKASPEHSKAIDALLSQPEESGVAFETFYAYSQIRPNNPNGGLFNALLLPLKDKAKWEKFLQGLYSYYKMPLEFQKTDKYNYTLLSADMYFAWNDQMACLAGTFSKSANSVNDLASVFESKKGDASKGAAHIGAVTEYTNLQAQNKDFLMWWNPDAVIDNVFSDKRGSREMTGYLFLLGLSADMIKGNHFAMWYDFQNGKIESGMHYRFSKHLQDRFGKLFKDKIETDFAPYIPKKNLAMAMAIGLQPNVINDYVKQQRMDLPANMWLGSFGLNTDLMAEGLVGDMVLASIMPSEEELTAGRGMEFMLGIAIKKPDMGQRLLNLISAATKAQVSKRTQVYELLIPDTEVPFYLGMNDKMVVLSSRLDIAQNAIQGGFPAAERADARYMSEIQNGWLGVHIDHQAKVGESIGALGFGLAMTGKANDDIAEILGDYDEAVSTTTSFGKEDAKMIFEMKTKDRNSLLRIIELSNDLYDSWLEINGSWVQEQEG